MTRRRITAFREAPVEMPSNEENAARGLPMGQPPPADFHVDQSREGVKVLTGAEAPVAG